MSEYPWVKVSVQLTIPPEETDGRSPEEVATAINALHQEIARSKPLWQDQTNSILNDMVREASYAVGPDDIFLTSWGALTTSEIERLLFSDK